MVNTSNSRRNGDMNGKFTNQQQQQIDMDVQNSKTVESLLGPLIDQINCMSLSSNGASGSQAVSNNSSNIFSSSRKGRSKRAQYLMESLIESIETFLRQSSEIAQENPEISNELMQSIGEIRNAGNVVVEAARDFVNEPISAPKRQMLVKASHDLLGYIARLLALADVIDMNSIMRSIEVIQQDLQQLKASSNQDELMHHFKSYTRNLAELNCIAGKRQMFLDDVKLKDEMASARTTLKQNSVKLLTSSKTLIRHPELSAAQANHEFIFKELFDSLEKIHGISTHQITSENIKHLYDEAASLATALDDLDRQVVSLTPTQFNESRMRPKMETQLENIISAVALMADSESTRPSRRDRIVNECNLLRQGLQDLLNTYAAFVARQCGQDQIEMATSDMIKLTKTLRKQLRKAVIDHVSDSFIETNLPLESLIESAKCSGGDEKQLNECAQIFVDHAEKLLEVSSMACSMSNNLDGIKLVRMAAIQVQLLSPQIVNAARILCSRASSKVALENMDVFREAWLRAIKLLTDSVDDLITINEFLSVGENHILDDLNRCVMCVRETDPDTLDRIAGVIRGRCSRVCQVVLAESDLYEPDEVINKIMETVFTLRDQLIPNFAHLVQYAVQALTTQKDPDDNGFIEASRLVYDGVHDVRNAVLMLYDHGYESDSEIEEYDESNYGTLSANPNHSNNGQYWSSDQRYRAENDPEPLKEDQLKNVPQEHREQIKKQLESFRQEKKNFDREVLKWDDKGNDIIVLAKQMCVIMMEMTDFTRGRGPLKDTKDIIAAAKKISECGTKLEKLAGDVAEECPESQSKRELHAYLKPIPLFCNQLNIASKVKANVIDVSGEPIITGVIYTFKLIV